MRDHITAGLAAATMLVSVAAFAADAGTTQGSDTWRASKLMGVPVYGPDDVSVGKISDLILGHDGKITTLVVGVGGFLGIGQKDVALPYDQVTFTDKPIVPPANPAPVGANNMASSAAGEAPQAPAGSTAMDGNAPSGATLPGMRANVGAPRDPTTSGAAAGNGAPPSTGPAAAVAISTAYPDHGTIAMTKDDLKAMPSFAFAK